MFLSYRPFGKRNPDTARVVSVTNRLTYDQAKAVKSLAIAYEALTTAVNERQPKSIVAWAPVVRDRQAELGLILYGDSLLKMIESNAKFELQSLGDLTTIY